MNQVYSFRINNPAIAGLSATSLPAAPAVAG
jgi:hypothetical protein